MATGSSEATTEHAELTELQINPLVPDLCPLRSLWFLSGAQWTRLRVVLYSPSGHGIFQSLVSWLGVALVGGTLACRAQESRAQSPLDAARVGDVRISDGEQAAVDHARWLIATRHTKAAVAELKEQLQVYPDSGPLRVLLGIAYLNDSNPFWAITTLVQRIQSEPADCDARIWLAWAYMQVVQLDEASVVLDHPSCQGTGPTATRAALERSLLADAKGQKGTARSELEKARRQDVIFESDRPALRGLSERVEPERLSEIAWQIDARRGYSSNPLLGSPIDPALVGRRTGSSFFQTNAWVRYVPDLHAPVRPSIELQARVFQLFNQSVEGQSYINPTGRAGVYVRDQLPRVLVAYRPEYLRLSGGDQYNAGPLWYVAAHRGETELEVTPSLILFAGMGKRDFRLMVRNRLELDGGVGGQTGLAKGLALLWAVSGRAHWTDGSVYNLAGATALANLQYTFGLGWQARCGVTFAGDWYPDSADYFGADRRRDLFIKGSAAVWSPIRFGLRSGLSYDYSDRDSTTPLYAFSDHRFTMLLAWTGFADLSGPSRSPTAPPASVPWGMGNKEAAPQERIRELLRQDEQTLQRSCGCRE